MRDERTLRNLLRVIVEEWGQHQVESALLNLDRSFDLPEQRAGHSRPDQPCPRLTKPKPSEMVEKGSFEGTQKEILLKLAKRFERKDFLPSTADVREFIFLLGERPAGMKDRTDAFRVLLRSLRQLSVDRLEAIELSTQYSGPSQLGPLSEAIAAAGASLIRPHRDENAA